MMYNNFSIVDYQKSEDENKAIQKLAEHRDIKLMVKEIGEKYGIDIQSTETINKSKLNFMFVLRDVLSSLGECQYFSYV